jgi:hypothetical protein
MPQQIITHIVPAMLPQKDGAGDYALNLALGLRKQYGIQSNFLVCDPGRDGPARVEGFGIQRLRVRNEACLWSLLAAVKKEGSALLLHYCAYGYHKQGIPFWLLRGINSWVEEQQTVSGGGGEFNTVFYGDMPSSTRPWQAEFCLRLMRRWLAEEIHRRSRLSIAINRNMRAFLDQVEPDKTTWLPLPGEGVALETGQPFDWNALAYQYRELLFLQPPRPKSGAKVKAGARDGLDLRPLPPYFAGASRVKQPGGLNPRPASVGE